LDTVQCFAIVAGMLCSFPQTVGEAEAETALKAAKQFTKALWEAYKHRRHFV